MLISDGRLATGRVRPTGGRAACELIVFAADMAASTEAVANAPEGRVPP